MKFNILALMAVVPLIMAYPPNENTRQNPTTTLQRRAVSDDEFDDLKTRFETLEAAVIAIVGPLEQISASGDSTDPSPSPSPSPEAEA